MVTNFIFGSGSLNSFYLRVFNLVEQSSIRSSFTYKDFYSNRIKIPPYLFDSDSSLFVPVIVYNYVESEKSKIYSENKGKAGIYQRAHKGSGKFYIGSAVDLSKRLSSYYSSSYLKRLDNYIARALLHHGYSAFNLSIVEYIDVSGLSLEKARKLILEREQFYFDIIFSVNGSNTYNILKVAGSPLGFIHSEESKALISEAQKSENNSFYGKNHSDETKVKMSLALSGENNPFYGKTPSVEFKQRMSGVNNPMFGKSHSAEALKKMSEARKGVPKTEEHKTKISKSMSKEVFVYSNTTPSILMNSFLY